MNEPKGDLLDQLIDMCGGQTGPTGPGCPTRICCAFPECVGTAVPATCFCPVHQPKAIRERIRNIVEAHFAKLVQRYWVDDVNDEMLRTTRDELAKDLANTI